MSGDRVDEIEDIVERIPDRYGRLVFIGVALFVALLIGFSLLISWPDIVRSETYITAKSRKVDLVANVSGPLYLNNLKGQSWINKGDYLAVIENSAELDDIIQLQSELEHFDLTNPGAWVRTGAVAKLRLGQIETAYARFLKAISDYEYYITKDYVAERIRALNSMKNQKVKLIKEKKGILGLRGEKLRLSKNKFSEDSILYSDSIIIRSDFERSKIALINSLEQYDLAVTSLTETEASLRQTQSEITQYEMERSSIIDETILELEASYRNLIVAIQSWQEKYAIVAPISGRVELLKFWADGDFVLGGDKVLSIIPEETEYLANVYLPSSGSGKVRVGQQVNISLNNFPQQEYGKLEGLVKKISLTSNEGNYLVEVDLPNQLMTTFDVTLEFREGLVGVANIVTNRQSLATRVMSELIKRLTPNEKIPDSQKEVEREHKNPSIK